MLVDSMVAGLSRHLQVPVLGRVEIRDDTIGPGQGATNSAQRVAAVSRRATLKTEPVEGLRVLLVDDLIASGWSMTLAAHWLRSEGASAVLPLALGSET
jgi:ATP-dependent DNA helicase RecQ